MPEIGASGTVRGGDGNILTYSATIAAMRLVLGDAIGAKATLCPCATQMWL
jgi:hypothetical protein